MKVDSWGSTTQGTVGLLGRYQDTNNYYIFAYEASELRIKRKAAGTFTTLDSKALTLSLDKRYSICKEMNGSVLILYVNGKLKLSYTDTSTTLTNG
ncbi:hypothetical protein ACFO9Q_07580 [Paenibacillus sp. GCM10023252]|uniref:hypothetical protein n=1 Tax=Paenibacillus sp. GCM10023252 TaxID=3252649 RepID=UPI00361F7168